MGRSTHWSHLIFIQSLALLGEIKAPYGHLHQSIRLGIRYKDSVRAKKYWLRSVCVKSTLSALTYLDRQRPWRCICGLVRRWRGKICCSTTKNPSNQTLSNGASIGALPTSWKRRPQRHQKPRSLDVARTRAVLHPSNSHLPCRLTLTRLATH
jgi:hypothetical protein